MVEVGMELESLLDQLMDRDVRVLERGYQGCEVPLEADAPDSFTADSLAVHDGIDDESEDTEGTRADLVGAADDEAQRARAMEFTSRKRRRCFEMAKYVHEKAQTEEINPDRMKYIRRLMCNRDSAAARRRKDSVFREQLCTALQELETRINELEKIKRDMEQVPLEYMYLLETAEDLADISQLA